MMTRVVQKLYMKQHVVCRREHYYTLHSHILHERKLVWEQLRIGYEERGDHAIGLVVNDVLRRTVGTRICDDPLRLVEGSTGDADFGVRVGRFQKLVIPLEILVEEFAFLQNQSYTRQAERIRKYQGGGDGGGGGGNRRSQRRTVSKCKRRGTRSTSLPLSPFARSWC